MMGFQQSLITGLSGVLVALCLAIGIEVVGHGQRSPEDSTPRINVPSRASTIGLTDQQPQRDAWFKEIVSRPLFSPDRRPVATDAHSLRGLPRLTGIVVEGSRRIAIFAAVAGGHAIVAEAGSHVGAYDVRDVTEGGVTVVGPEGTSVVHPIFDVAPPPSATLSAAARPQLPRAATR